MKQFSNIFIGTAINQQGPLAERANNSLTNSTTLTMTSEFSFYFYQQSLLKLLSKFSTNVIHFD